MKRSIGWLTGFGVLLAAIGIATMYLPRQMKDGPGYICPFCRSSVLEKQSYYEGDLVRVLVNFRPLTTGHSLIIPKRHVARLEDLTPEEFAEMGQTIKKVQRAFGKVYGTDDFLLVLQNGEKGGQTVFHTHFHMLPRQKQSSIAKANIWFAMLKSGLYFLSPIDWTGLEKQRAALQSAML